MELKYFDIAISCLAAALAIGCAIWCGVDRSLRKSEKLDNIVIFSLFFLVSIFGGVLRFYSIESESDRALVLALQTIVIAAKTWLIAMLVFWIADAPNANAWVRLIWQASALALAGVISVLLFANCFTPYLFGVDDGGKIVIADGFFALAAPYALLWIAGIVLVFVERKKIHKYSVLATLVLFLFFAVGTALDVVFPQVTFFSVLGILAIVVEVTAECAKREERLVREREEGEKLRNDVMRAKAQILQSQVSPHFIYNALTAIQALPDNPDATKKAIGDFAKYLRQTLTTNSENELIPFEKELENIQAYCRLEKIRFGNKLNIVYDIEEKDFEVPAMSIQILAENAVKHGVSVKRDGGTVCVSTKKQDGLIVIVVKDDGVGFDPVKTLDATHVGINNVTNRIRSLLNGTVKIESEIGRGTTATVTIPESGRSGEKFE
ncbi:MAG: histidine kinase [Clostridia bacterium]|nr:histidine kinase [Clostridia bacterium]